MKIARKQNFSVVVAKLNNFEMVFEALVHSTPTTTNCPMGTEAVNSKKLLLASGVDERTLNQAIVKTTSHPHATILHSMGVWDDEPKTRQIWCIVGVELGDGSEGSIIVTFDIKNNLVSPELKYHRE